MIPVQYIISTDQSLSPLTHAKAALAAGCKWIQLSTHQEKSKDLLKIAKKIKEVCRAQEATFIIENEVELVKEIDGDGVHLTNGASVGETRQTIGEGFLIGANATNAEEAISMKRQSADYLCIGPSTTAIEEGNAHLSLQELAAICNKMEEEKKIVPLCAIGNFTATEIPAIAKTGMRGITVRLNQKEITEQEVQSFLSALLKA